MPICTLFILDTGSSYVKPFYTQNGQLKNSIEIRLLNLCFDFTYPTFYRPVHNMSAQVLLSLLNELGKSDKMRGLPSILSLFCNKFNKFNNTGAQMLDSNYRMTLKLFFNQVFWFENVNMFPNICDNNIIS